MSGPASWRPWVAAAGLGVAVLPVLVVLHVLNRWSTTRVLRLIGRAGGRPVPGVRLAPVVAGQAVNGAARLVRLQTTSCLARSQVLWCLLSLAGHEPVICVGADAALGAGGTAHAWVELDGAPIGDRSDVAAVHPPFDRPLLGPPRGQSV